MPGGAGVGDAGERLGEAAEEGRGVVGGGEEGESEEEEVAPKKGGEDVVCEEVEFERGERGRGDGGGREG